MISLQALLASYRSIFIHQHFFEFDCKLFVINTRVTGDRNVFFVSTIVNIPAAVLTL